MALSNPFLGPTAGRPRFRIAALATALLLAAGLFQVGQGIWIHAKAGLAQLLLQRAWTRTLAGARQVAPWPWADTWPVGRLTVAHLGVDLIVLANASGRTLAFGPAVLGSPGTRADGPPLIVTGHRDTHFQFLARLAEGDLLVLTEASGASHRYRVRSLSVIDSRMGIPVPREVPGQLLLITCYPFDALTPGGPLRYLVEAARSEAGEAEADSSPQARHR